MLLSSSIAITLLFAAYVCCLSVTLFPDSDFRGNPYTVNFNSGCECKSVVAGFNDQASSAKWDNGFSSDITFFDNDNCDATGRKKSWSGSRTDYPSNFNSDGINDMISSVYACPSSKGPCSQTTVDSGMGCDNIAAKCKISRNTFCSYNTQIDCSKCNSGTALSAGQDVCCSPGGLPDSRPKPNPDGTCVVYEVKPGDGCGTIAAKYPPMTVQDLDNWNSNNAFQWKGCAAGLQLNQRMCISSGKYLSKAPKQNPDGSCNSITFDGRLCWQLSNDFEITSNDIEKWNSNTWMWTSCNFLGKGQKICLSPGTPPLPEVDPEAQCGMTSLTIPFGAYRVPSNSPNAVRNATCPLGVCCSQFGYCGFGSNYCDGGIGVGDKPWKGCQSNCGRARLGEPGGPPITQPTQFIKLGYFESWNVDRPCLVMMPNQIPDGYTHIHYAFANVSSSYTITMDPKYDNVFQQFKSMTKFKKVVSVGGWAFSDPGPTRKLFTEMTRSNRPTFINSVVNFLNSNALDGIDFDWEYPGTPDRDGSQDDAANYLTFIREMKAAMPPGKTLSIAAPASFWYLREFYIKEMAQYLDYIVYMTYDLHGQWDYNIKSVGPFLRSHVNMDETLNTLTMITKAGIPTNKLLLGVATYGRSFKQADPSCSSMLYTAEANTTTTGCKFLGTVGDPKVECNGPGCIKADPGKCTKTGGYLALGEIDDIISNGQVRDHHYDGTADAEVMSFGSDQWVSWTTPVTIDGRSNYIARNLGLAGTAEWAVDLRAGIDSKPSIPWIPGNEPDLVCDFSKVTKNLTDATGFRPRCVDCSIIKIMINIADDTISKYDSIMKDPAAYDDSYEIYEKYAENYIIDQYELWFEANMTKYFDCEGPCSKTRGDSTLTPKNLNLLYDDLEREIGVNRTFIDIREEGKGWLPDGCNPDRGCILPSWSPYPRLKKGFTVNPKNYISMGIDEFKQQLSFLKSFKCSYYDYYHDYIIDGNLLPILIASDSVQSMNDVISSAKEIRELQEKANKEGIMMLIILFSSIATAFIPGMTAGLISGVAMGGRLSASLSTAINTINAGTKAIIEAAVRILPSGSAAAAEIMSTSRLIASIRNIISGVRVAKNGATTVESSAKAATVVEGAKLSVGTIATLSGGAGVIAAYSGIRIARALELERMAKERFKNWEEEDYDDCE